MNAQHTPGPWSNTPMQETVWAQDGQVQVAKVSDMPWANGKSDWLTEQANARLIAAAPDLLDALGDMLEAYAPGADHSVAGSPAGENVLHPAVKAARAAIAKATGGGQ